MLSCLRFSQLLKYIHVSCSTSNIKVTDYLFIAPGSFDACHYSSISNNQYSYKWKRIKWDLCLKDKNYFLLSYKSCHILSVEFLLLSCMRLSQLLLKYISFRCSTATIRSLTTYSSLLGSFDPYHNSFQVKRNKPEFMPERQELLHACLKIKESKGILWINSYKEGVVYF